MNFLALQDIFSIFKKISHFLIQKNIQQVKFFVLNNAFRCSQSRLDSLTENERWKAHTTPGVSNEEIFI